MGIGHARRNPGLARAFVLGMGTLIAVIFPPRSGAVAWTLKVLHSFCAQRGCTHGIGPEAGLIMDGSGHLYGTTNGGGAHNGGTVFELTPNAARTKWTETVLYSFCAEAGCTDGYNPYYAGLIMDGSGRLYGTTTFGGELVAASATTPCPASPNRSWATPERARNAVRPGDCGVVFELTPNAARTKWTETVLYSFCAHVVGFADCTDGNNPFAGLIMDGSGHLYGTTELGGAHNGGTVFELTPNAARTKWTETVLYSFCEHPPPFVVSRPGAVPQRHRRDCIDGWSPYAGLIMDGSGHLYGTTYAGGAHGGGVVFELTPNAARTKWTETVLYSFCAEAPNCADGSHPYAGLIMDGSGHLYGTTSEGGARAGVWGGGVVFELTPNAARTKWTETVLHSFPRCVQGSCAGDDGSSPEAGLIMDGSGHLYGTTNQGGTLGEVGAGTGFGTVFELTPNVARTKWTETVLHSFCADPERPFCIDGDAPRAGLIMDGSGHLYGTASGGSAHGGGVVFELKP
jgi:uncharacterized repeat protein (TIGR03803 family)